MIDLFRGSQDIDEVHVTLEQMDPNEKWSLAGRLLRSYSSMHPFIMAYSGGKDSVLMDALAKDFGVSVPKFYSNTTIDPPGTISFCKRMGCTVVEPEKSFFELFRAKGLPSMFRRWCCSELKERYLSDYVMCGIRRSESIRRSSRYTCFESSRVYSSKLSSVFFYPLLWFNDNDVAYHIERLSLECHPLYYDSSGRFCVSRRLGCVGCPLASDRGRSDFRHYPRFARLWVRGCLQYAKRNGWPYENAYWEFVRHVFYSNHGEYRYDANRYGLFPSDPKHILEDYFGIDLSFDWDSL